MKHRHTRHGRYDPLLVYTGEYIQTTLEEAIRRNEEQMREWESRLRAAHCVYKTRTTRSGRMLEVEVYPAFLQRKDYSRALKQQRSTAAQKQLNEKKAKRKLVRLVHANFGEGDLFFTGGFTPDRQPDSLEACKREVSNFFKRLWYHARRAGVERIRYLYVIEQVRQRDGRVHFHLHAMIGREAGANLHGVDARDWIESKWTGGDYANTRSLQWKRGGGFTGISTYFTEQFEQLHSRERAGLRHWGQSLGLKPWSKAPGESYSRFRKRQVASLVRAPASMKEAFEREFPGYRYLEEYPCEVCVSDVLDGAYLYCRMYREE